MSKLLAILTLALAAIAITLAVRGQFARDDVLYRTIGTYEDGGLPTVQCRAWGAVNFADSIYLSLHRGTGPGPAWKFKSESVMSSGFDSPYHFFSADEGRFNGYVIKHWLILGVTIPLAILFNWRAWRRRPGPGDCQKCGYDLRASTDRCPECGTAIAGAAITGQSPPLPDS